MAAPERFAYRMSTCAALRTWVTVPGADSTVSVHMVWMESITTSRGVAPLRKRCDDVFNRRLSGKFNLRFRQAQPFGAQPHLRNRFFT